MEGDLGAVEEELGVLNGPMKYLKHDLYVGVEIELNDGSKIRKVYIAKYMQLGQPYIEDGKIVCSCGLAYYDPEKRLGINPEDIKSITIHHWDNPEGLKYRMDNPGNMIEYTG